MRLARGDWGEAGNTSACPLTRWAHTRPLPTRQCEHSRCSPGAAAGPLNPCVIQESGLTATHSACKCGARSSRAGDSVLSHPDNTPREGGHGEDNLDLTLRKSVGRIQVANKREELPVNPAAGGLTLRRRCRHG